MVHDQVKQQYTQPETTGCDVQIISKGADKPINNRVVNADVTDLTASRVQELLFQSKHFFDMAVSFNQSIFREVHIFSIM